MTKVSALYERLRALPAPALGRSIDDFALYEALLAGCADRLPKAISWIFRPCRCRTKGTLSAVAALRAKPTLSDDERSFLEYFDLLEEIRLALGGEARPKR